MKRYSNLYGTIYANSNSNVAVYASVGSSQQLPAFLNEIGATNAQLTVDTVRNILAGFPNSDEFKAHYAAQPQNDLPVSVRYAPMHLRNHPDMPNTIKPFTAIGVSGSENKRDEGDTRYSTYVQTFYIGREHMHEPVAEKVHGTQKTYNYLDQIFGTRLLSHGELAMIRGGRIRMDYDALPGKVEPRMQLQDRTVVFNAVDAVFDNKTVVIRLEKGCGFNQRAWELLIPIYSLMPPRLATEIGFATYLNPAQINKLAADTSMRIFVLPGECEMKDVDTANALVMDLSEGPVRGTAPEEMGRLLNRWNKMPWDKRQPAMERIFADTAATFNDKSLFIQRSNEFLDQADAWEKGGWIEKGAFTSLEALKAKYESLPLCSQIPWMKEAFIARVPVMMQEKGAIHKLTGQALARWRIGGEEAAREIYEFGLAMGGTNPRAMADTARDLTEKLAAPALVAQKEATARAIAEGEAAVAQAKAEGEAAVAKAVADGEAAKTAAVAAGAAALAQARAEADTALTQARTEGEAAVAAEREKTEQVKKVAADKIKAERDAHQATQQKLDAEAAAHQTAQQQLRAVSQECEAVKLERDGLNQRLERAKNAYTELKQAKAVSDGKIAAAESAQAAAEQAKTDLERERASLVLAQARADKTIRDNNKRMVMSAAAGFLAAALIFGVILLVMGLAGDKDIPEETIQPTTQATEAPTEAPTEEPTQAPTEVPTEAPTEPEDPDLTVWTDDGAALWLQEQIPGIEEIQLQPVDLPGELDAVEDYLPVAKLLLTSLEAEVESYAVLLQRIPDDGERMVDVDRVLLENEEKPGEDQQEPTDGEEPAEDVASLVAVELETALAVLTSEEFVLAIYGDSCGVGTALEAYGLLVDEDAQVLTRWNVGGVILELDELMHGMRSNAHWWRDVTAIGSDETTAQGMELLGVSEEPLLVFVCESGNVLIFDREKEGLAEDFNEKLLQAGHFTSFAGGTLVAVVPLAQ